jgi:hypothetical protein
MYKMIDFFNWMYAIKNSNVPLNNLTAEKEDLLEFAQNYPPTQTGYMAQSLLQIVNGNNYERIPKTLHQFSSEARISEKTNYETQPILNANYSKSQLLKAIPNPFTNETTISYTIESKVQIAEIRIMEIGTGRLIKVEKLNDKTSNSYVLYNNNLSPGVYAVQLIADNLLINSLKIVFVQ